MIPEINYEETLREISENVTMSMDERDRFAPDHFLESENAEEFQRIFNFFQGAIIRFIDYPLPKMYFYIVDKDHVNAFARKSLYEPSIIGINRGAFIILAELFRDNPLLFQAEGLEQYFTFENKLSNPLNELMCQFCGHHIFYHELGHIIQGSDSTISTLDDEEVKMSVEEIEYRHLKESDSDLYAAFTMARYLNRYIVNWTNNITEEEIEYLIAACCASIFTLLLTFKDADQPLYFKEKTHPHAIVRVFVIIPALTDYLNDISNGHRKYSINLESLIEKCVDVCDKISKILLGENLITDVSFYYSSESINIKEYAKILRESVFEWEESTVYKTDPKNKK